MGLTARGQSRGKGNFKSVRLHLIEFQQLSNSLNGPAKSFAYIRSFGPVVEPEKCPGPAKRGVPSLTSLAFPVEESFWEIQRDGELYK